MKYSLLFIFIFGLIFYVNAQEKSEYYNFNDTKYKYFGFELLGSGGIYSLFFEKSIFTQKMFSVNIKPRFEYVWGSDEDSIPRHLIPFIGLNFAFGFPEIHLNVGISTAMDYSYGNNHNKTYFFHSISIGPRFTGGKFMLGIDYNYFLRKPEFFSWKNYPNYLGLTMGFSLTKQ
ncbi:MAG: hypothetical protein H0W84_06600 [Bacteroidetes bacterium]|nr:hypothetical protein [Bacteroidota bacterium]